MERLAGLYGTWKNKKVKQALAVLSIVLIFAEKLVESEFSCPCDTQLNIAVVALYFIVPALLIFILMCFMLDLNESGSNSKFVSGLLVSFIPALMWVSLLLFDGHFLTCAATDWPGTYVTIEINGKKGNQNWCEPTNSSSTETEDKLFKTQWWLCVSQIAGLSVLGFIAIGIVVVYNGCRKCCCRSCCQEEMQRAAREPEAGEEDDPLLND